ncbi:hypothetical protein H6504_02145 [Candidatus Woesearchaeota archaeon]|nr:hypothetical protein [Candidatus Woesearchaeota archaeon]
MKLGFLKQIFEETQEELQEQIEDAEKTLKKAQSQLKNKKKGVLSFFQASADDLKEQIEESKKIIAECKKKLKESAKRTKEYEKQRKAAKKQTITFLKNHWGKLLVTIIIILALWYGIGAYKTYQESYKYTCADKNPCTDCLAAVSCVDFDFTGNSNLMDIWFTVENRNDKTGDCVVHIKTVSAETKDISHPVGLIAPKTERVFKIQADIPTGTSESTFNIECDWR